MVVIGTFAITIYMVCVWYLAHTSHLDFRVWDLSTVTASDFTVEMTITEDMWNEHFLTQSRVQEPMPTHAVPSMQEMRRPIVTLA